MKGVTEPQYSVGLLEGGTALCDVINNHIYEQTLVRNLAVSLIFSNNCYCIALLCLKCRNVTCVACICTHPHVRFLPSQSEKSAFLVADLGVVMRQHVRWRAHMAQIRPYYPVRCNSSPAVIKVLAALGTGFMCTNKVCSHNCIMQCFGCTVLHIEQKIA